MILNSILSFAQNGLLGLKVWQIVIATLVLTHITIASVTIFLHRHQTHRALELHSIPSHFFRFWLWLTTGMVTKEWVAIHRKHHARVETPDDPHSPQVLGIREVLLRGSELYRAEAKNQETLARFGQGTPNDWIERHVYTRFSMMGIFVMLAIDVALFGVLGITVWAVQMLWIPITAAGIINGVGHYWGYRNWGSPDASRNILPWGIVIGGEELHNNHHAFAQSARLSTKPWEFDIGWVYIRALERMGLAKVKKLAPVPKFVEPRSVVDAEGFQAVLTHRYDLMAAYARSVKQACRAEVLRLRKAHSPDFRALKQARKWLAHDASRWTAEQKAKAAQALAASDTVRSLIEMRTELEAIWERQTVSRAELVAQLQAWCERAEASQIAALEALSLRVRGYSV